MIYFTHYFLDADKPEQGSRPIGWFRTGVKIWTNQDPPFGSIFDAFLETQTFGNFHATIFPL